MKTLDANPEVAQMLQDGKLSQRAELFARVQEKPTCEVQRELITESRAVVQEILAAILRRK